MAKSEQTVPHWDYKEGGEIYLSSGKVWSRLKKKKTRILTISLHSAILTLCSEAKLWKDRYPVQCTLTSSSHVQGQWEEHMCYSLNIQTQAHSTAFDQAGSPKQISQQEQLVPGSQMQCQPPWSSEVNLWTSGSPEKQNKNKQSKEMLSWKIQQWPLDTIHHRPIQSHRDPKRPNLDSDM